MGGLNRTTQNHNSDKDCDFKLKQYMLINNQISKTLSSKRVEIATLKNSLQISASEIIHLQLECHKWKKKFVAIRKMYIDHIHSITSELQTNADKINIISGGEIGDNDDSELSHPLAFPSVASPTTASTRTNDSRRDSKSFESTKNRSVRSNVDYIAMDTIDEENAEERPFEADTDVHDSKKEGDTDEESGDTDEESEGSDKSISDSNDDSPVESVENEDESEESEEESESSDDESETDVEASMEVMENEKLSQNEIEAGNEDGDSSSDAENKSGSVEQITLHTTNYDSTLKNEDSDKENGKTSPIDPSMSAQSIIENSESVISVDGQSLQKSSLQNSLNKLPTSKRTIKARPVVGLENHSIKNQTFGTKNVKGLVSSTPYRNNNNLNNVASVEISIASPAQSTRSRSSNLVISMEASVSSGVTANGSQLSATSMQRSRPKRKVAPLILLEPKLNTKLRRPR